MSGIRILITGYLGFIGSNLHSVLKKNEENEVKGLDFSTRSIDDWQSHLISELDRYSPEVIFHVGACANTLETDVQFMFETNYESTKILLDWASQSKAKVIYSSSAANYGTNGKNPSNLYAWSKYVAENIVTLQGGIALRYFNVYGPGEQGKGSMASLAFQAHLTHLKKERMKLFPGSPRRDFIYIADVVEANLYALENYDQLSGHFYEVGSGVASKFEQIMEFMDIPYEHRLDSEIPKGYQFYTCSNQDKWMPGWKPNYDLKSGLQEYMKFLRTSI